MSAPTSDSLPPSSTTLPVPSSAPPLPFLTSSSPPPPSTSTSLLSGAVAGVLVDVVLFPLDTIKTRMQSQSGFHAAGGFHDVYAGIASAAIGSAPSAACFFVTYEAVKHRLGQRVDSRYNAVVHSAAAACAELVACLVRVPTDNIKQKRQAGLFPSTGATFSAILASPQGWRGFYTGYASTIMRESHHTAHSGVLPSSRLTSAVYTQPHPWHACVHPPVHRIPFSLIQFPLYERMKAAYSSTYSQPPSPLHCAAMGSLSGSIAAALTTPMDVVKTRMMLGEEGGMWRVMSAVYQEGGVRRLFSGVGPRVLWIGLGGAVFLGGYELAKTLIEGERRPTTAKDALK